MSRYARPWRALANTAAAQGGSIHDDDRAQELGFKGAFVPGSVVASAAIPLIFERYGKAWMEGGWFSFTFVIPVYTSEEVQAVACAAVGGEKIGAATNHRLSLQVATRDKRLCCQGEAGLGFHLPWVEQETPWGDVFPELHRDFEFPPAQIVICFDDIVEMLYAAGDDTPWYLGPSPWGAPVVPPEWLLPIALQTMVGTRVPLTGAKGPGIWARHQLAICRPLRYDTPYTFSQHVVGKGSTARTLFVEYEFEVTDADGPLVIGRHQGKFLKRAA